MKLKIPKLNKRIKKPTHTHTHMRFRAFTYILRILRLKRMQIILYENKKRENYKKKME